MLEHFVESQQLTPEIIKFLFKRADHLHSPHPDILRGKVLATLFYEPSTRTRLSFESAMLKMGGQVLTTENAKEFSSAIKGESMEDTIRVVGSYADCVVIRHYEDGAAKKAASISPVPVINAGDGKGQHPTQALLDVYTIYKEFDRVKDLKITMVGDLAYGRTVRSLCYLLGKFEEDNIEVTFVSPENLRIGQDIKEYLSRHNVGFIEADDLNRVLPKTDIIYMTRIQKERMRLEDYNRAKGKYVINQYNFELIRPDARILHPLPHVEEIDLPIEVEQADKRVAYFRQVQNGLYARMAVLDMLINKRELSLA